MTSVKSSVDSAGSYTWVCKAEQWTKTKEKTTSSNLSFFKFEAQTFFLQTELITLFVALLIQEIFIVELIFLSIPKQSNSFWSFSFVVQSSSVRGGGAVHVISDQVKSNWNAWLKHLFILPIHDWVFYLSTTFETLDVWWHTSGYLLI